MVKEPNFEGEKMKLPVENVINSLTDEKKSKAKLGLIFTLVGFLLIILGGLLWWYKTGLQVPFNIPTGIRPTIEQNIEPETPTAMAEISELDTLSTSDEISAIESDIESTQLNNLEKELLQIDAILTEARP